MARALRKGLARQQAGPRTPTKDTAPIQNPSSFVEAFQSITYGHKSARVKQTD